MLWASRRIRRPVKWVATRSESMLTDHCGREMVYYGELALDERGKILALRARCLFQLGAYFVGAALAAGAFSVRFIPAAYDIQTLHIMSQGLFTNTSQTGPYRGAGRPEAAYFMERLIEQAARTIGMDPAEIRRRNLIPPSKLPYATPTLWTYDSGEFVRLMDKCMETSDWKGFAARKKASEKNGRLRGRAVSYYIEFGGIFNERMDLRFNPDGTLNVFGGTHSHGQGHATVFAQLVHDRLGVPFESIRYVQGDTAQVAIGRGTYAARSATVGGNALMAASDAIIEKGKPMAAALMEADAADIEFKDGQYRVVGTDKAITIIDVAKAAYAPAGPLTEKFGVGLEASGSYSASPPSHPNGSHVCELEVDPDTGEVVVDRYFVVDDLGRVLNPMIVRGQIHGGVVQGIGQALIEHQVYDRQSGQLLSGSFMDYGMPRADMMPDVDATLEEVPCKTNPLGVKGIGESGTIGAPPTVINALIDALAPLGVDHIDMPATPARVWETIARAKAGAARSEQHTARANRPTLAQQLHLSPLAGRGRRAAIAASRVRGTLVNAGKAVATMRGANSIKTTRARRLRRDATKVELKLWNRLRSRAIDGCKFVRQEPIGPYVVDFACRERRLVIEVDGGQHATDPRDAVRDRWLAEHRYRVLRFWNNDVMGNIDGVLEVIALALQEEHVVPTRPLSFGPVRSLGESPSPGRRRRPTSPRKRGEVGRQRRVHGPHVHRGSAAVASPRMMTSPAWLTAENSQSTSPWPSSSRLAVTRAVQVSTSPGQKREAKRMRRR